MTTDAIFIVALLVALATYIITGKQYEMAKQKRGKIIVIEDKPDTRTICPKCKVKANRPLKTTKVKHLNGEDHRWGTYKCEEGSCKQWFTRKLPF